MIALICELLIAAGLSYWLSGIVWWLPLLSFPMIVRVANSMYEPPQLVSPHRLVVDTLIMLTQIVWLIASVAICVRGFASWWGVAPGLLAAWLGWGMLTPRRWADEVKFGQ